MMQEGAVSVVMMKTDTSELSRPQAASCGTTARLLLAANPFVPRCLACSFLQEPVEVTSLKASLSRDALTPLCGHGVDELSYPRTWHIQSDMYQEKFK